MVLLPHPLLPTTAQYVRGSLHNLPPLRSRDHRISQPAAQWYSYHTHYCQPLLNMLGALYITYHLSAPGIIESLSQLHSGTLTTPTTPTTAQYVRGSLHNLPPLCSRDHRISQPAAQWYSYHTHYRQPLLNMLGALYITYHLSAPGIIESLSQLHSGTLTTPTTANHCSIC